MSMRFDLKTKASPEQVLRALTDFTDARLQIWSRTLDPKTYGLRDSGETWAVARESSPRSPFWVVVRYDWSDPESVRCTVLESSYGGGGEGLVQIAPGDDGGSRVHAEWGYSGARLMQRPVIFLINHGMGRLVKRMWASAFDRYAESSRNRSCPILWSLLWPRRGRNQDKVADDVEQERAVLIVLLDDGAVHHRTYLDDLGVNHRKVTGGGPTGLT